MKPEAENWWKQAKKDLNTGRNNLKNKDYYAASFFAQQSVEKGLKALQIKKEKKIIKTHDLLFLAKRLNLPENLSRSCDRLNPIYIQTRYPDANGGFEDYSEEESKEDLEMAEEVLKWIEQNL